MKAKKATAVAGVWGRSLSRSAQLDWAVHLQGSRLGWGEKLPLFPDVQAGDGLHGQRKRCCGERNYKFGQN